MHKPMVWLVVVVIAFVGLMAGLSLAADTSPWLSSADPTLQKVVDLPDNTVPNQSNLDCDKTTTRLLFSSNMVDDCVVQTPLGLAGDRGVVFTGSSETTPIVPPPPFVGLHPIPNQSMVYTYSSSSVFGMYMQFYRTIRDKMKPVPDLVNGGYQYTLTKGPDFTLKNLAGTSQPMNPDSLAFSQNGNWMVLDFPFQGFVRVNLATFDMVPFAPSMNRGSDYAGYTAQLSISNDGRYVVIKPGSSQELRIYDISTCANGVLPVNPNTSKCQSRNYWPDINSQLPGLRALYQPRFTSSMQLSVTAQYAYTDGHYKVGQYSLTAPGENPLGIEYLGMGDSYASGQGAFNYISGTDTSNNTCHLSSLSYPFLLSTALFTSGHSVACSGAETSDIISASLTYKGQVKDRIERRNRTDIDSILTSYSPGYVAQNEFVDTYNPQIITLSVAGNDIGFEDIVTRCVSPSGGNTCYATKEDQQELASSILNIQGTLQNTYRSISSPNRKVYVIGYPQIVVAGGNCAANVHLNEQEIKLFVDLTDLLNQTIQAAAAKSGVRYVDVSNAFAGHRMCETKSSDVAVNGLTAGMDTGFGPIKFIGAESYHPNALGHELLKQAILRQTHNFKDYIKSNPAPVLTVPFPYSSAPATGRGINTTVPNNNLVSDTVPVLTPLKLHIDTTIAQLKSSSAYNVRLDQSNTNIGTATSDPDGVLDGSASVPGDTTCGYHTLHIFGLNIVNEPIDIYKEVYISSADCSPNTGSCQIVPDSGKDVDKDGIDDACDPVIGDPPSAKTFKVYLTGSSIHASR